MTGEDEDVDAAGGGPDGGAGTKVSALSTITWSCVMRMTNLQGSDRPHVSMYSSKHLHSSAEGSGKKDILD